MLCQWKQVKYCVLSVFLVPVTKYLMKQLQREEVYSCLEFQRSQFATVGDWCWTVLSVVGGKWNSGLFTQWQSIVYRETGTGRRPNCDLQRLVSQTLLLLSAPQLSKWCPKLGTEPLKHESLRDISDCTIIFQSHMPSKSIVSECKMHLVHLREFLQSFAYWFLFIHENFIDKSNEAWS